MKSGVVRLLACGLVALGPTVGTVRVADANRAERYDPAEVRDMAGRLGRAVSKAVVEMESRRVQHVARPRVAYPQAILPRDLNPANKEHRALVAKVMAGSCNPAFFDQLGHMLFRLKRFVSAGAATEAFLFGSDRFPTVADCAAVIDPLFARALTDPQVLGRERVDQLFGLEAHDIPAVNRLVIDGSGRGAPSPMSYFLELSPSAKSHITEQTPRAPIRVGEMLYYRGVDWYSFWHPGGAMAGFNVLCVGQDRFLGFGLGTPVSEAELKDRVVRAYNQPQTPLDRFVIDTDAVPERSDLQKRFAAPHPADHLAESTCRFDPEIRYVLDARRVLRARDDPPNETRRAISEYLSLRADIGAGPPAPLPWIDQGP